MDTHNTTDPTIPKPFPGGVELGHAVKRNPRYKNLAGLPPFTTYRNLLIGFKSWFYLSLCLFVLFAHLLCKKGGGAGRASPMGHFQGVVSFNLFRVQYFRI